MTSSHEIPLSQRWLDGLERVGNKLPHPTLLFMWFCWLVLVISALCAWAGVSATHPVSGEALAAKSLISGDGLRWILGSTVKNFVTFAPVGTVLVAMLGIGVAEHSGLLGALLRRLVQRASGVWLTALVVFGGVMSSIAADAGYVVLIPLAALMFKAAGRHPLAGIAAAFAGVSGGYSANLVISPVDAILSSLSTEAVALIDSSVTVAVSANYYFTVASVFLITLLGTWLTQKIVEPRLGVYEGARENDATQDSVDSAEHIGEKRGLRAVLWFTVAFVVLLVAALAGAKPLLANQATGSLVNSPLLNGIVVVVALYAAKAGALYGYASGKYTKDNNWIQGMEHAMSSMAGYLVLMFFAAQFVNYFAWTQLGAIVAIKGAAVLAALDLNSTALLIAFVLVAAMVNLVIGSASAKWALFAPVFIPALYLAGISPDAVQMAYRIGDSSTNIITPLMPYFGVVVAFVQQHQKNAGMGTLIALMFPYSIGFLIVWSLFFGLWVGFGLPLGFG